MNITRYSIIKFIFLPLLILPILIPKYFLQIKSTPFQYWDEYEWVSTSYFAEFYNPKDLNHPVWKSFESYDQPKLTELLFGFWLSMKFYDEIDHSNAYPYTTFLLKNNYTSLEQEQMVSLLGQKSIVPMDEFTWFDGKRIDELQDITAARLVHEARILNLWILLMAIIITYYLLLQVLNPISAFLASVYYGLNILVLQTALTAQSEAIFLLTFNTSLLFLLLHFRYPKKTLYYFMFLLFTGLCTSTKLNGLMLLLIYFVIILFQTYRKQKTIRMTLTRMILSLIIPFLVLIMLNPYTHSSPIVSTYDLFHWRVSTSTYDRSAEDFLSNPIDRIQHIAEHFTATNSEKRYDIILDKSSNIYMNVVLSMISLSGFVYYCYYAFKDKPKPSFLILSFLTIVGAMSFYLFYDWPRYYIQVVIFIIIFQVTAVQFILYFAYNFIQQKFIRYFK